MLALFPIGPFNFDPLAVFFLAVIAIVSIPSAIYSIGYLSGETLKKRIVCWTLLSIFALSMCLVVVSDNLFSFLVFWEAMSLASYFLVVSDYRHEKSIRAGTIYLVMTHAGTASLMGAFFMLYNCAGSFDFSAVKDAAALLYVIRASTS